jgi:hypothetical protein
MLRKLILGAVAAVAIGLSAGAASAAPPIVIQPGTGGFVPQPYPPFPQQRRDHDYAVYVRHRDHWHFYGRYENRWQAERVERYLESRGQRARIEVIHDHRR